MNINQIALDPEVPQGGTIKETVGWEASMPSGTHTFYVISIYGTGNTRDDILANAVAAGSKAVLTAGMTRQDDIFGVIGDQVPVGTYSCVTFVAENFDGATISGIYDEKIDFDVLTVVKRLGAEILSTSFSAV